MAITTVTFRELLAAADRFYIATGYNYAADVEGRKVVVRLDVAGADQLSQWIGWGRRVEGIGNIGGQDLSAEQLFGLLVAALQTGDTADQAVTSLWLGRRLQAIAERRVQDPDSLLDLLEEPGADRR